jgi:hypothetical protein
MLRRSKGAASLPKDEVRMAGHQRPRRLPAPRGVGLPGRAMPLPAGTTPPDRHLRGHLRLATENNGLVPWCGPAAVALATGHAYADACDLLRRLAPGWYPQEGPVVTAYWRDLLAALRSAGVPLAPVAVPEHRGARRRRPTLLQLLRGEEAPEPGWYLVRVTDHFLLLRVHGFGLATLHDNRHTGALVTGHTHGRRAVTHMARLLGGPLVPER